jgi:hypothetical protein
MVIGVFNPVGEVAQSKVKHPVGLSSMEGKRVGFVCNHHPAITELWAHLEKNIERDLQPSAVRRVDKNNISMPQPAAELAQLAAAVDYVVVGVGA